jgi:polysaccharide transporter, PST family
MQFIRKSFWSFTSVFFRGMGALVINKIFALYFGTSGITLLAHFQNLIALFTQIPNDGINRSLIKNWADPDISNNQKQDILSGAILMTAISFSVIMVIVFLNNDIFIEPFIKYMSKSTFLIIVIFSIMAILMNLMAQSLLLAYRKIRAYSILTIISIGILILFLLWSVNYQLLEMAFIAYALGSSINLIFTLIYINRKMHISIKLTEPSKKSMNEVFQFILMALSVLVFGKLIDFFMRSASIEWFGMTNTGHWQSLVKLSDSYVMVFVGTVGVVFFPEVSALVNDKPKLIKYLNSVLSITVPALAVLLTILYMLGEPILTLLFTDDFKPAYGFMHFQVIGDFFMLVSYLFAYILMAQKRTWAYILLQAISAAVYLATIFLLRSSQGIESILIGHVVRNIIFFAILVVMIRKLK